MLLTIMSAVAALQAASAPAPAPPPLPPLKVEARKDVFFILTGDIGNIAVSDGKDGLLLVDDNVPRSGGPIRAVLDTVTDHPVRYVINTHHHGDHVGGNREMAAAGAVTYAHDNVRVRMSAEQYMRGYENKVPPVPESYRPVMTFTTSVTFNINGDVIRAIHAPNAHTDGDSIVHFAKANAIHMGDIFFNGMFPYIDVGAGGSVKGMIAAVDRALAIGDEQTVIIPGHGAISDKAGLRAYKAMLEDVMAKVEAGIASGMTMDAIRAGKPAAAYALEGDADKFVEIVYDSLTYKP